MTKTVSHKDPGPLDIRRYPNRRYYDASRSRHVTLEELHRLIRDGYELRITDTKSAEDITGRVLAQIILELDTPKLDIFPVELLHRVIRSSEGLVRDFTETYFNQALRLFMDSRAHFEEQMRQTMGLGGAGRSPTDWARAMWAGFTPPAWPPPQSTSEGGSRDTSPAEASSTNAEDMHQVVHELRKQIQSLQQELTELKDRKPPD